MPPNPTDEPPEGGARPKAAASRVTNLNEPPEGGARPKAAASRGGRGELADLARRRWRVAITLTVAMMATYFGFLFLVAYAKPVAGSLVAPGLSVGIVLGALVIVVAWVVTGIYVVWANRRYDGELARLRDAHRTGA